MFMFKVCRMMCVCVLFNLDCRSKSIWHLNFFFVIHKSTVALCLRLCLFFRTFYCKYAYSCYAYKKKLVYSVSELDSNFAINSVSDSDSDSESDFSSVFMNLNICIVFILYLYSSK